MQLISHQVLKYFCYVQDSTSFFFVFFFHCLHKMTLEKCPKNVEPSVKNNYLHLMLYLFIFYKILYALHADLYMPCHVSVAFFTHYIPICSDFLDALDFQLKH